MRARNLKPGFFSNEQLAEVTIPARLLFTGLWCMADREGRLEYRPKRIKMQVFPADAIDVEPLLHELQGQTLIRMYEVEGITYVWIPGFGKHQRPHPKEVPSVLPPPPDDSLGGLPGGGIRSDVLNPDVLNPESSSEGISNPNGSSSRAPEDGAARATREPPIEMPADWEPNELNREWLAASGLTDQQQTEVVAEFRQWAMHTGNRKAPKTWQLAFFRNTVVRNAVGRARSGVRKNGSHQQNTTAFERSRERLEQWAASHGIAADKF